MDPKEYREYLFSRAYFRDRLLWVFGLAIVLTGLERVGLLDGVGSGVPGRAYAAVLVTTLIVAMWIVCAVLGVVGLYRWLRA